MHPPIIKAIPTLLLADCSVGIYSDLAIISSSTRLVATRSFAVHYIVIDTLCPSLKQHARYSAEDRSITMAEGPEVVSKVRLNPLQNIIRPPGALPTDTPTVPRMAVRHPMAHLLRSRARKRSRRHGAPHGSLGYAPRKNASRWA